MTSGGDSNLLDTSANNSRNRIVFHVDMDCFYAGCERLRDSSLTGEPVVIGMGYEEGSDSGVVATASYEARDYGVESAQPISEALQHLPEDEGHYLPVDIEYYKSISADIKEILHEMADVVREVSVDEAYLDVTEQTSWEHARGYAQGIKTRIQQEVGVTASIGVAPNMSAAKIASDVDKPDGLYVVPPDELRDFLAPLDLEEIHELGEETARELRELGIETAGELATADPQQLEDRFGKRGRKIYQYARGEDKREVTPTEPPKSFLRDSAFTEPTTDIDVKREQAQTLAQGVADRAREHDAMYRTIGIKVVTPPFEKHRRSRTLSGPVDNPELVEEIALDLLEEFHDNPIRKLGVTVSNLTYSNQQQAGLDDWTSESEDTAGDAGSQSASSDDEEEESGTGGQVSLEEFTSK